MSRSLEASQNIWVNIDSKCSLLHELLVTTLHYVKNPVCKRLFDQRVGHVDDPLPRKTPVFIFVRQVGMDYFVLQRFTNHFFDAKTFILGHR